MNNTLANIWLFATHWTKLDAFDTEEAVSYTHLTLPTTILV